MPNGTFFNLPEEKRTKIVDMAISEFAEYGFDKASVSRIVNKSGIAKGSFYQYFDDKRDLFKYLMEISVQEKLKYLSPVLENPSEHDFFTLMREMYLSGIRFAQSHPKLVVIGNKFLNDKEHPIFKEIIGENLAKTYDVFEGMLKLAIARGEVRGNVDTRFISYIISSMNIATAEYYQNILKEGFKDNDGWYDGIMDTVNEFINFLQYGIGAMKKGGSEND